MNQDLFLAILAILGTIALFYTRLSPLPAIQRIRQYGKLDTHNAIPYPVTCINCLCWIFYGIFISDVFVYAPNVVGYVLSCYYTLSTLPAAEKSIQTRMMLIWILGKSICFSVVGVSFLVFVEKLGDQQTARTILGVQNIVALLAMNASPLMVIRGQ